MGIEETLARARAVADSAVTEIVLKRASDLLEELQLEKRVGAQLWGSSGGKSRIANRLIPIFPEHKTYGEVFAGGAAVFWAKTKEGTEVLNDMDKDIAGALKFVQGLTDAQVAELKRMDWKVSEAHHKKLQGSNPTSPAASFHRMAMLRFGGFMRNPDGGMDKGKIGVTLNLFDRLPKAKERLAGVKIHSEDYRKVMSRYDGPDAFFFLDPPYTKTDQNLGERGFDHKEFWSFLGKLKGKFMVTYDAPDPDKKFNLQILEHAVTDGKGGSNRVYKTHVITNYKTKRIEASKSIVTMDGFDIDGQAIEGFDDDGCLVEKQVPKPDASTEDKRKAQQDRSKEFGIEALEGKGERLTFPKGFPTSLKDYGDPCLAEGTPVYTARGPVPVEDIRVGDVVSSLVWEHTQCRPKRWAGKPIQRIGAQIVRNRVLACRKTGTMPVFEIRTCEGTILATANHKFLKLQIPSGPGTQEPRSLVWKRLDELEIGDRLIFGMPHAGPEQPRSLAEARLLGFYLGDGWMDYNSWTVASGEKKRSACRIQFACADEEEAEKYADILAEALMSGDRRHITVKPHHNKDNVCFVVALNNSDAARNWLAFVGSYKAHEKRIPDGVWGQTREALEQVLEGYVDADGYRSELSCGSRAFTVVSASFDLISGIRHMARYVGWGVTNIHARSAGTCRGYASGPSYSMVMYPDRVHKNANGGTAIFSQGTKGVHCRTVQSITPSKIADVYDIQTETENFVADGFVVHNCNLMYPLDPPGRARNARARFKQFAQNYEKEASRRIVHTRIVERLLEIDAKPSFDEDDPLDKLLPAALKDKLKELAKQEATQIQTLILSKDKFKTLEAARKWVREHDFKTLHAGKGPDETENSWRFRQRDPGDFQEGSFRTIDLPGADGVKAVIGRPKTTKRDDDEEREVSLLPIEKTEEEKRIVFGVVLEPNKVDAQNDTISPEEIEQTAHEWLAKYQNRGFMHRKLVNGKIEIYESYIAPVDMAIGGQKVKKGTWLLMYHVKDDDIWQQIKSGKLTGFSMGGFARRVPAKAA